MKLQPTETVDFQRNVVDCFVCLPCYDKLVEVNDFVNELEQIQAKIVDLSEDIYYLFEIGVERHAELIAPVHGIDDSFLSPEQLRENIMNTRKPTKIKNCAPGPSITHNLRTRNSSSSPVIVSVRSIATSTPVPLNTDNIDFIDNDFGNEKLLILADIPVPDRTKPSEIKFTPRMLQRVRKQPPLSQTYNTSRGEHSKVEAIKINRIRVTPTQSKLGLEDVGNVCSLILHTQNVQKIFTENAIANTAGLAGVCNCTHSMSATQTNPKGISKKLLQQRAIQNSKQFRMTRRFPCLRLGCRFFGADADSLTGHVLKVHNNIHKGYKCNIPDCSKAYTNYRSLKIHLKCFHGGQQPFKCDKCDAEFSMKKRLAEHENRIHSMNPPTLYPCSTCERSFINKSYLQKHFLLTHGPKAFTCPSTTSCSSAFATKQRLESHQGRAHPEEFPAFRPPPRESFESICAKCGKIYTSAESFKMHMRQHEGVVLPKPKCFKRSCEVPDCVYKATTPNDYKVHKLSHGVILPTIPCLEPGCRKLVMSEATLKTHYYNRHTNHDTHVFQCEICGQGGFKNSKRLEEHVTVKHSDGRKDFVCLKCNEAFAVKRYLDRHVRVFTNCKPKEPGPNSVHCSICKKWCCSNNSLNRHMQLIHNREEKPWSCGSCNKTFSIKMYLTRHLKESKLCPASKEYNKTTTATVQ